jgi:hypothetical protein
MKRTLRDRIAALAAMNVPALREQHRRVSEGALRRIAKMPLWEDQRRASRELFGEPEALE